MSSPEVQAAKRTAPREDKYYQCDVTTTQASVPYTTLATALDLSKPLRLEAAGGDVTFVCGRSGKTLVVGTTADSDTNRPGSKIFNGESEEYWLADRPCDRLYFIGSATCKLNIWESSDLK